MKAHSNEFKNIIKKMGRQLDSKIIFGNTELGKEHLNSVTPSFQGAILKSVMKQLDIDSNVPIPVGTILNYKFGVKVNGEYEYLDFGNYIVKDVEKQEDTMSYKITCYDKLLYSMTDYVDIGVTYPITIKEYISKICSFLGISFANNGTSFVNFNKKIDHELYLDASGNSIGYTFRDVFDELAQVTASTICINDNDQLEIRYIKDTYDTIDEEFLKNVNVNFGEKYGKINSIVLSRSGESDNVYLRDEASVEENGLCELKIVDNQIMNWNDRSDYLPEILNKLNGLEYYLNDFASTGITYYDLCDRYNVVVGEQTYSCVMFNDEILVTQGLEENVFTEMPEETKTDYTKADKTDRKINQTYLIVDKQNQQIESVISQTDAQNQKIAQVTQTVEELNSKISDIADITTSQESNNGYLEFEDINQSEPIRIVVRPIGESITNIYPRYNLYPTNQKIPATEGLMPTEMLTPSEMLVPLTKIPEQDIIYPRVRKIKFENVTTGKIINYELPSDLLYYNSEVYDEFIMNYDTLSCVVNKKVGKNADGSLYILPNPTTIEYEYPHIELEDGSYKIKLIGYETAYIFVRLMAQNIYTTQFATKAELNSEISQTSQEINLSVDKKLESYSTTTEMNSAIQITANGINQTVSQKVGKNEVVSTINQSAEEIRITGNRFVVEADNFSLDKNGNMTCNDATLRNANFVNGAINITQEEGETTLPILLNQTKNGSNYNARIGSGGMQFLQDGNNMARIGGGATNGGTLYLYNQNGTNTIFADGHHNGHGVIQIYDNSGSLKIALSAQSGNIRCTTLTQTSLEESKKNFEKLNDALDIVKNTDIYKYNFKTEKDGNKKHIGAVIGKKYNYSSEITGLNENGKEVGIDTYSMVSVLWKAVQEQQNKIEELEAKLKESDINEKN